MRAVVHDEVVAGVIGAAAIAAVEVIALGEWRPGMLATVVALMLGLGLVLGAVIAASEWVIEWLRPRPAVAAGIRAAGGLIPLVPLGATLFDGGFAATLPGASLARVWLPAVGVVVLAAAVWGATRLLGGVGPVTPRVGRAVVVAGLAGFVVCSELANRRLFRSEYPTVHAFLIVCSCVAATVAVRLATPGTRLRGRRRLAWRVGAAVGVVGAVAVALTVGLRDPGERWAIAERGTHSLHLTRMIRNAFDFDGDSYAVVLGGGDCDEGNPAINRGALDIPNNGIDEDCDGVDAAPLEQRVSALSPAERLRYASADSARSMVARAREAPVILLSVDALRADQLEPTDANRAAFPTLFALLDESVWFRHAFAPAAGTDVSLSSFVTGRVDPFVPVQTTLLEAIAAGGRRSGAVLPREVLRWAPTTLLTRGLDTVSHVVNDPDVRDLGSHTTSTETTNRALAFVDRATKKDAAAPFLLWVHYFDVHEHKQIELTDRHLRQVGVNDDLSRNEQKYRALVRLTDREIARLFDGLASRGILDRAVIVLFSDHGESLGEDPRLPDNHGKYVYNALTRVPLAIRVPQGTPRQIVEPVSLLDVFPTLVELLSLPPVGELDGFSQFLYLLPEAPPEPMEPGRALPLNESHQWGVVVWPHKLMVRPDDNLVELYDLEADALERNNLLAREPALASRLKRRYHAFAPVSFDRSPAGRRWRERQARRPASP